MSKFGKILGLVAILAVLAMGATMALAQAEETDDGAGVFAPVLQDDAPLDGEEIVPDAEEGDAPFQGRRHGRRGGHGLLDRDAMKAAVADALGISVEELEAAREEGTRLPDLAEELGVDMEDIETAVAAATEEAIAQAVADGEITQEQADEILAQMELRQTMRDIWGKDQMQAAVADALGISVEELEAAHEEGTRLPDLAEELGVDLEDVQADVAAARETAVNQAVADGLITQEQADEILSRPLQGHGPGECGPGGRGGRGGRGGPGGRFGGGEGPQGGFNGAGPAFSNDAADA